MRLTFPALTTLFLTSLLPAQDMGLSLTNGMGDEHVDVPPTPFVISENAITIEAWMTYDDSTMVTGGNQLWPTIVRHTDTPNGESYILRVQAGSTNNLVLTFGKRSPGGALEHVNYPFTPGEFANWTHVAATFRGTTGRMFINGLLVATTTNMQAGILDGGGTLRIGNGDLTAAGNEVWNGKIDEVRIWPYGRFGPEILEDMNKSIGAVPGALTFPLDGHGIDTSQGIVGTPTAGAIFVAGAGTVSAGFGASSFGASTTNCPIDGMVATLGSSARAGNTAFAFVCADTTPSVAGALLLTALPLAGPLNFLGVDFYIDFGAFIGDVPVTANNIGTARIPVPLPPSTEIGLQFYGQFLFIDACGSQGLTSSNRLDMTIVM